MGWLTLLIRLHNKRYKQKENWLQSIAEELLHTTIRLEGQKKDGTSVGTGFFFAHNERLFVVTNKHVVEGVLSGQFLVLQGELSDGEKKPLLGKYHPINFTEANFIGHPDPNVDVAVMNLSTVINELESLNIEVYLKHVGTDLFPTAEHYEKFIGPMEEIVFVGYPSGIWDTKNLLPIARKGMTASPCYIDFEGEKKFLVDASVFPGSSGSPVFVYYVGGYADKAGNMYAGNRIHFLGIIAKVFQRVEKGDVKVIDIPTEQKAVAEVNQMIDLGIVFKAETIVEACDYYVDQHNLVQEETKPLMSRNSPCLCGSGNKFKHCCGKLS